MPNQELANSKNDLADLSYGMLEELEKRSENGVSLLLDTLNKCINSEMCNTP